MISAEDWSLLSFNFPLTLKSQTETFNGIRLLYVDTTNDALAELSTETGGKTKILLFKVILTDILSFY